MANGRVVFDDVPAALTEDVARELYGIEADEVIGAKPTAIPAGAASVPMHA
jgi:phosphonate transport system ATP-binding protein